VLQLWFSEYVSSVQEHRPKLGREGRRVHLGEGMGIPSLLPGTHVSVNGNTIVGSIAQLLLTDFGTVGTGVQSGPSTIPKGKEAPVCALHCSKYSHTETATPSLSLGKPTWHSVEGRGCWSR
jgi:hypothetical protein